MNENTDISQKAKKYEELMEKKGQRKEEKKKRRKALRAKWETLNPDDLHKDLERRLSEYHWFQEYHPDGMDGMQRVDIVGKPKSGDYLVFVEVERGRTHPIDNVVKAWRYIEENEDSKPVLLVEIFSPYFRTDFRVGIGRERRMTEAIFIGKQAEKATRSKLNYEPLGPGYWPGERLQLDDLIKEVLSVIENYRRAGIHHSGANR